MKKYGETLRQIRMQKGYTMQQLASGILSVSFLSKFERGESDISLQYITRLLEKLSLTFEEFFYWHNNHDTSHLEAFFDQADEAYTKRNLDQLKQLRKTAHHKWEKHGLDAFRCNTCMLDVYERIIVGEKTTTSDTALDFLYAYLFDVEIWGYYELRLYNSTMLLMPPVMVTTLSKTALEKSPRFGKMKQIDKMILPILINTLIFLLGQSTFDEEQYNIFHRYLERLDIPEDDLYIRNACLQIKGIHEIKMGHREQGIEMVKRAISIFKDLGSKGLATTSKNYLDVVLDKEKE